MSTPPLVAVIDSGWNRALSHRRVLPGASFVPDVDGLVLGTDDDHDRHGHGTACARLVLRQSASARVLPVRIFDTTLVAGTDQLIRALWYAKERGVSIISLSLSCEPREDADDIVRLCKLLVDQGIIIVAAKQNHCSVGFPADLPFVIAASALAERSCSHDGGSSADEMLVEVAYESSTDDPFQREGRLSNSFSTAAVAGAIARLFEERGPIPAEVLMLTERAYLSEAYKRCLV